MICNTTRDFVLCFNDDAIFVTHNSFNTFNNARSFDEGRND